MATHSQQIVFNIAANKQKIDQKKEIPSNVSTSFISKEPNNFWKKQMEVVDNEKPTQTEKKATMAEPVWVDGDNDLPEIKESIDNTPPDTQEPPIRHTNVQDSFVQEPVTSIRSVRSQRSLSSSKHPKKRENGWTTIAPPEEDVAKDFYIDRLRKIYRALAKPFDENRFRHMSLRNLKFKYNRMRTDQDVQSNVRMISFVLLIVVMVIEKIVGRFIKVARLQNYTLKLSKSKYMNDINRDLKKIVQRYFRSGTVNPFMGILGTMICTMTMYNFDQSFLDTPKTKRIPDRSMRTRKEPAHKQMPQPSYVNDSDEESMSEDGENENANGMDNMAMSLMTSLMQNDNIQGLLANALPQVMGAAF